VPYSVRLSMDVFLVPYSVNLAMDICHMPYSVTLAMDVCHVPYSLTGYGCSSFICCETSYGCVSCAK
jgi:hypothetical protein